MDRNSMYMLALSAGREGQVIIGDEFFAYNTARTAVANAASATVNIAVEANSDFMVEKMTYVADIALATQTDSSRVVPNVTAQINATGSGRNMFNIAAPIPAIFGTGGLPFILPRAYLLPAASTIQITLTNYDAAAAYNITLTFAGRKLFWGNEPRNRAPVAR
jgi:hypothetical protein